MSFNKKDRPSRLPEDDKVFVAKEGKLVLETQGPIYTLSINDDSLRLMLDDDSNHLSHESLIGLWHSNEKSENEAVFSAIEELTNRILNLESQIQDSTAAKAPSRPPVIRDLSSKEEEEVRAQALADPDVRRLSPDQLAKMKPARGRPFGSKKTLISLRLDDDVLEFYKSNGPGYQTRIRETLRREMERYFEKQEA